MIVTDEGTVIIGPNDIRVRYDVIHPHVPVRLANPWRILPNESVTISYEKITLRPAVTTHGEGVFIGVCSCGQGFWRPAGSYEYSKGY